MYLHCKYVVANRKKKDFNGAKIQNLVSLKFEICQKYIHRRRGRDACGHYDTTRRLGTACTRTSFASRRGGSGGI